MVKKIYFCELLTKSMNIWKSQRSPSVYCWRVAIYFLSTDIVRCMCNKWKEKVKLQNVSQQRHEAQIETVRAN